MKKLRLIIVLLVCCFLAMPTVMAASATTVISGTNTVKVGNTTKVYIKLNSSDRIEGADVSFTTSGNITVTNVEVGSGLSKIDNNGNRYILYAKNPVASGSSLLILTVKGTKQGTGTITVDKMDATVSGTTVYGGTKSYKITVNPVKTQAEIEAEQAAQKKAEEEAAKALAKATELVEKAEESLEQGDYDTALAAVNALANSDAKTALLKRLEDVKFEIAVKERCETCENTGGSSSTCNATTEDCGSCKPWIILSIVLFIALLIESGYLIYNSRKEA